VAHSVEANGVRFYENGVVSLNLPIAQEALRSRASRTTHPLALHLLSRLCSATIGADFTVDNPFLFKTKTDVVASIGMHHASGLIGNTCSCSRSIFQSKTQPHCGHCSQCIDRRFATLASGLQEHDSAKGYASDVFVGIRNDVLERAIAIDYVRHGLELARKSEIELVAIFNAELSRAVRHFERRSDVARDIISMHKRHGEVVNRVLEQELRANAAGVVGGTLNPTSLLAMVATRQHLPSSNQQLAELAEGSIVQGTTKSNRPEQSSIAAILASLENLHRKIDAGPARKAPRKTNARPTRRDSIVFAAITLGLEGTSYSAFLRERRVNPRWEMPCPSNYDLGYKAGQPWRKKIQDEKCRAKTRMKEYSNSALADAFNFHLPDKFQELSRLLNSRNSLPTSKNLASLEAHKYLPIT
jgi:hypothetical protein